MSESDGPKPRTAEARADAQDESYRRFFDLSLNKWELFDSVNLKQSRVLLASDLNPLIDFFNSSDVGIGGRDAKQASAELNLDEADQKRLAALLRLRSYDVFTLRAALGAHLSPERFEQLTLPESERRQLEEYTRDYTRALFALIFEETGVEAGNRQAMRDLLEGTSKEIVQRNVMTLASKFAIKPTELVNYIAGVGEMLLAIAFYRRAFEVSRPLMHRFLKEIKSLLDYQFIGQQNLELQTNIKRIINYGARTMKSLDNYFQSFNDIGRIWENLTPERFRDIRDAVESQYPTIGSTLCIWQVKLDTWNHRFHRSSRKASDNSPIQFAVFFQERIYPNFEKIEFHLDRIRNFDTSLGAGPQNRAPVRPRPPAAAPAAATAGAAPAAAAAPKQAALADADDPAIGFAEPEPAEDASKG